MFKRKMFAYLCIESHLMLFSCFVERPAICDTSTVLISLREPCIRMCVLDVLVQRLPSEPLRHMREHNENITNIVVGVTLLFVLVLLFYYNILPCYILYYIIGSGLRGAA